MKYFYLLFILGFCQTASAVCSSEDLTGYWDFYDSGQDYAFTCSLRMSSGKVSLHRFGCKSYGNAITGIRSVSGTLSIDSFCHVSGRVNIGGVLEAVILKATLNQGRNEIHGIGAGNVYAPFKMIKFY